MPEYAFPFETDLHYYSGMTLRDYFAAAALTGLAGYIGSSASSAHGAKLAYEAADYMLKEREREQTTV